MHKVLIIEDDPILLKMYSDKFTHEGYKVLAAIQGLEGLEKAINEQPDFIVLDLMLPNMTGYEVLKQLKKHDKTKNIPVATLTVVPEDIAETTDPDIMKKVNGYWRKDKTDPAQIVENVHAFLKNLD